MSAAVQPSAIPDSDQAILGEMPLGVPPETCIEARMTAAESTRDFINWVALDSSGIPRSLKFDYQREGKNLSVIVPIPLIAADELSVDSTVNESVNATTPSQHQRTGIIPCPQCRELIEFSIRDLLSQSMLWCRQCELVLTLNRSQSPESLEALSQMQLALEQFEANKNQSWRVMSNTIEPQIERVGPPNPALPTSPILRAKPSPEQIYCFYNGNRYSTGELLCIEGRLFQSFYGTWVDKGKNM